MGSVKLDDLLTHRLGSYPGTVHLTTDRNVFRASAKAIGEEDVALADDDAGAAADGYHPRTREKVFLIGVFDGEIDTLQHEVNHAALAVAKHCSFDPREGNGEPFCFMAEAIFSAFRKGLLK